MEANEFGIGMRTENREEVWTGLKIHLVVTVLVSLLLAGINLLTTEFLWFIFPVAGMSFGMILHYLLAKNIA